MYTCIQGEKVIATLAKTTEGIQNSAMINVPTKTKEMSTSTTSKSLESIATLQKNPPNGVELLQ